MSVDKSTTKKWLHERGLTEEILTEARVEIQDNRIVIPIINPEGHVLFNKYRRAPHIEDGPKYTYETGAKSTLFGLNLIGDAEEVVLCEGELDALLLNGLGIAAVCSTGGAGTFKEEWFESLTGRKLFICFDNDEAGKKGMERIALMYPTILKIPFPPELPEHADITDFIIEFGVEEFKKKMKYAFVIDIEEIKRPSINVRVKHRKAGDKSLESAKQVPLTDFIKTTSKGFARCPFHNEKTASFRVFPDNRYHCFGCGADGDVVDYIMKTQNLSFHDAIKQLTK